MLMFVMAFAAVIFVLAASGYLYLQSMKKKIAKAKEEDQKQRQERLDSLPTIPLSERDDTEQIKAKTDALAQAAMKLGEAMYKAEAETTDAASEGGAEGAAKRACRRAGRCPAPS